MFWGTSVPSPGSIPAVPGESSSPFVQVASRRQSGWVSHCVCGLRTTARTVAEGRDVWCCGAVL
ncbi:hypothetical protein CHLRE_02g143067v5 [Chlamydomonas reinhardtii]|uniref:Uncharacterized protein n=1 Tax=Chlamydomonas reinhardtii TaxID=3055 RepID=A0A2K3E4I0_CHLRE|nr:uncharacterized protein CHLRE_17g743288v5 [Chlamydomonas reinhardtii]XP_042923913.1 uncharacterized protein CHLRE_06g278292v5 [Chlamydomonas reinhardtii]XP_042927948.1 uncharacterized protein CHLRE_02g143067v5 [Chlamydomonas reinhardtii]XP_042927949.1 uncharacterized protein CHLRE_02g143067v5 [Chlamydomonas reinhardtii]PNW71023.1 hypothetical protein CHLRE_17g743288v5 [Chlamydomonas reinhardtii]PNW82409.1 hypothetical protein CHLRE_06g278292v5 [Chlamydomonas reinhardtii]PNW87698.1 hypothet